MLGLFGLTLVLSPWKFVEKNGLFLIWIKRGWVILYATERQGQNLFVLAVLLLEELLLVLKLGSIIVGACMSQEFL